MWPIHTYVWYTYGGLSVGLSICHDRESCKNGWTNRYAVWFVAVGPRNQVLHGREFLRRTSPGHARHVRRSIYSKRLSRGQHRYGADADWGVLDDSAHCRHHDAMRPYVKLL